MPTILPMPIEFRLPEGWLPARPEGFDAESVVAGRRRAVGSADAPALTQRVTFSTVVDGARCDLVQSQVYLSLSDAENPHKRAVIRLALTATATATATAAQHDAVLGDFQDFVRTVRPDAGAGA